MSNRNSSWEATLFSLACAFQCKQGRANSLRELRLRLEEIVACHADASSRLRDTPCHPDPVILRPSPELGAHRVRATDSECGAPALSASWRRTTPVPVVLLQQRSVSKPKKNGATISSFLRASDIGAHENHPGEPARVGRDKDQSHCGYHQGAPRNDGTQQNADRAPLGGRDRDRRRYNLRYLSRLLRSLFPWFPHFFRSPPQPAIVSEAGSQDVSQHKRARRSLLFTAPGDIPKIADVSEMLSSWISRSTKASR